MVGGRLVWGHRRGTYPLYIHNISVVACRGAFAHEQDMSLAVVVVQYPF